MWPPITVATPRGTGGAQADSWKEDLEKRSPFLSTESAPALYLFALPALVSQPHGFDPVGPESSPPPTRPERCKSGRLRAGVTVGDKRVDLADKSRLSCEISHSLCS